MGLNLFVQPLPENSNMDLTAFFAKLADNALTLAAMAIAVWWLQKTLAQFIGRWDEERSARLDAMEKAMEKQSVEIKEVREENKEGQRDRIHIHTKLLELYRMNPTLKHDQ
jgi:hypothetical protein